MRREITCRESLLLPVYNRKEYVSEAIESILNQTYEDFELLLLHDVSIDGSASNFISLC